MAERIGHIASAFGASEVEERASGDGQQQACSPGDPRGPRQRAQQPLAGYFTLPEPHQGQCTQQRHSPLHDDERHRHGAEFIVSGQVFEGEFGEPHQVAAPGQQNHHDACGDDPPFVASPGQCDAQRGEEHRRGAQIGRAARVGLCAPVGRELLRRTAQSVVVQHGCRLSVGREGRARFAAHEVGHEQVECLGLAVAPCRRIVEREAVFRGFGRCGQLRAAADGLLRVLGRVPQGREVRSYGQDARRGERRGAQEKVAQASFLEREDSLADPECGHRHEEIIGDLRVVGADFERRRKPRERRAAPDVTPQGHPRAAHHQRSVDQRPHFRDVPRADDQQEVGRKPVGQRRDDAHPRVDSDDQQHEPHRDHGEKQESGGRVDDLHDLSDG